ncbi:9840_t:CDS:2 [Ambispora leptoticha]|uniref:9840_t:CDS:1 n=1 Tax=Ambispora leptoticha TaxID=144679 RepID=A0A9N8WFR1_9GLOM|nr:9840_t:CDS:2 [Ambispora leptoticha]
MPKVIKKASSSSMHQALPSIQMPFPPPHLDMEFYLTKTLAKTKNSARRGKPPNEWMLYRWAFDNFLKTRPSSLQSIDYYGDDDNNDNIIINKTIDVSKIPQTKVSKLAGISWKREPEKVKRYYRELAKDAQIRFREELPAYFKPTVKVSIRKDKIQLSSPPIVIGRGAMGEVYLGTFQGKQVVIKKSLCEIDVRKEYNNYFRLQNHPNLLKFYGVVREDRHTFSLVLEYAPNGNLSNYLKVNTVTWEWKAKVCRDIALGLIHCHNLNVVHFDLKPENVLLSANCVPKLADFGVSKTKSRMELDNNKAGGTLNYVAPERVCREEKMRAFFERFPKLSDVYSYGLILWSVAKDGDHPYDGMDDDEIREEKRSPQSSLRLMNQLPKTTPEGFSQLIFELIQYNPQERKELTTVSLELEYLYDDDDDFAYCDDDGGSLRIDFYSDEEDSSNKGTDPEFSDNNMDSFDHTRVLSSSTTIGSSNASEREIDEYTEKEKIVSNEKLVQENNNYIQEKSHLSQEKAVKPNNLGIILHRTISEPPQPIQPPQRAQERSPPSSSGTNTDGESQITLVSSPKTPKSPEFGTYVAKTVEARIIEDTLNIFADWENVSDDVMSRRLIQFADENRIEPSDLLNLFLMEKHPTQDTYFAVGFMNEHGIGKSRDHDIAFQNYHKAVDLGDVRSEIYLGWCYYKGTGTTKDPPKAFDCFKNAANKGCVSAINNVGWCYDIGFGTTVDPNKAFEYFKRSAEKGYATAQCRVGVCYEYGRGTIKDLEKALEWYGRAAEQGHEMARKRVTELTKNIPRERPGHRRSFFKSFVSYWFN